MVALVGAAIIRGAVAQGTTGANTNGELFCEGPPGQPSSFTSSRACLATSCCQWDGQYGCMWAGRPCPSPPTTPPPGNGGGASSGATFRFNLDPEGGRTGLRDWAASNSVQLAEFAFYSPGGAYLAGATATNPGGSNPRGEGPGNVYNQIDDQACSSGTCRPGSFAGAAPKWLDFAKQDLVFAFHSVVQVGMYDWMTADDSPERDPVGWTLERLTSSHVWETIDSTHAAGRFSAPRERHTWVGPFRIALGQDGSAVTTGESNGGNMACWSGAFTAARCCDTTNWPAGDSSCWSGTYDFEFCCPAAPPPPPPEPPEDGGVQGVHIKMQLRNLPHGLVGL